MTQLPATARALLASALSVTALLPAAACSVGGRETPRALPAGVSPVEQTPASVSGFTDAQAQAALITEADLGEQWMPTRGAATWRDGLLKARTEDADCQHLLDVLYTEELFGTLTGPGATTALDDRGTGAQLRYRIATHRPADVDRTLAWLKSLPQRCGQFTATTTRGFVQSAQVDNVPLPKAGDARQALRVTLAGETEGGDLTYLTVDVAAVRVGDEVISLTNAGLDDVGAEVTQRAVRLGAQRLEEIRTKARAEV